MIVRIITAKTKTPIGPLLEVVKQKGNLLYCQYVNDVIYGGPGAIFVQLKENTVQIPYYCMHISEKIFNTVVQHPGTNCFMNPVSINKITDFLYSQLKIEKRLLVKIYDRNGRHAYIRIFEMNHEMFNHYRIWYDLV